ncbi:hypothetical protein HK101_007356 [Irineochytrium annulatum]|nr:hypothetical protein HK101_007356 [Irineochytrium annulatum]
MIRRRSRSSAPDVDVRLTRLEGCGCLVIVGCIASALALSLSAFMGTSGVVFSSLQSLRRAAVFISVMLYVDSILVSNPASARRIDGLRYVLLLLLLVLPFAIVFSTLSGLFADQGLFSASASINAVAELEWQGSFVLLLGFLLVARWLFVRFLSEIVVPQVEAGGGMRIRRRSRWSTRGGGRGVDGMVQWRRGEEAVIVLDRGDASLTEATALGRSIVELEAGLKMAIRAMTLSAAGIVAFLLFDVLFALALKFFGTQSWFIFLQVFLQFG